MQKLLRIIGSVSAISGMLLCAASGLTRLSGQYHLAGFEATTLFILGTGLMVFACVLKLEALSMEITSE